MEATTTFYLLLISASGISSSMTTMTGHRLLYDGDGGYSSSTPTAAQA
jgi:hypothetical protein